MSAMLEMADRIVLTAFGSFVADSVRNVVD